MVRDDISGLDIFQAFVAGKNRVVSFREELNRINVFPVNDSDTGNNLSATLTYITDTVTPEKSPNGMLKMIADASLNGARGNSGIIFAQFINGLAEEMSENKFQSESFPDIVNKAVPYAYRAVSKPAEGTILTVIKEWAESLKMLKELSKDFKELFVLSIDQAKISLEKTPEKLKVLKDAKVVDAGAQGFIHFLEGIGEFITGKEKALAEKNNDYYLHEEDVIVNNEIVTHYCCEALLT